MNMLDRLALAYKAIVRPSQLIDGTVRSWEVNDTFGRRMQKNAFDFVQRYSGYVKVAVSRNASAVASSDMRLYRRTKGDKSAFKAKRVSNRRRESIESVGCARTKAVTRTSDDIEEITDPLHPINALLRTANPQMTGFEMMEYTEMLQSLAGTFYWITVQGSNGYPVEIWPGFPQYMRPVASKETLIDHYVYGRGMEVEFEIGRENVVTFKRPNPTGNPYYGLADLAAVTVEADLSAAFARFALAMLDRGAQPGLIVMGPLSEDQRKQTEANLRRKYEGIDNAGRSLVMSMPAAIVDKVKIEKWESAQKEAGYLAGQSEETVLQRIAAAFDVPVGLISLEDQAVANGRVAAPHWQLMSILPRCRRIQERLNEEFVPKFFEAMNDDTLFLAFDNPVAEDSEVSSRIANANYVGGLVTLNEARSEISKPPVPDGDKFKPEPSFGGPGTIPGQDEEPTDATPALTEEKTIVIHKTVSDGLPECTCECADHGTKRTTGAKKSDVDRVASAFRSWLSDVLPMVSIRADGSFVVNLSTPESAQAFYNRVGDVIDSVFERAYNEQARELRKVSADFGDLGVDPTDRLDYFTRQRQTTFSGVSRTTTDAIMRTLREGAINGETPQELQARVQAVASNLADYQAERIARTEVAQAYTSGNVAAWKDSEVVAKKEWLLASGSCPVCNAIKKHNSSVELDQPFVTAGTVLNVSGKSYVVPSNVYAPPGHPNCRCDVAPIMKKQP